MKLLIIPTLNEKKNILNLVKLIQRQKLNLDILFVDDNSSDGTKMEINKLKNRNKNIYSIFRPKKMGIGSAHKDAFKFTL